MAFGQASGPPARAKQVEELLELVRAAGHADFRDARGPLGFTQRQAGGKFTQAEAEALIDRLRAETEGAAAPPAPDETAPDETATGAEHDVVVPQPKRSAPTSAAAQTLRRFPSGMLAAELQRRGWIVVEP